MIWSLDCEVLPRSLMAAATLSDPMAARPSSFFRLPVELRIMIYHKYILDHPSALCNPRQTTYEGRLLLKSDKRRFGRAQTYIRNNLRQETHSLYRITGPALFKIPWNELDKAFAQSSSLNEHIFCLNPENTSSIENWAPSLSTTDCTRVCFAVDLNTSEGKRGWVETFQMIFRKQFAALKYVHIYLENVPTEVARWSPLNRDISLDLPIILMEMPSVNTFVLSYGKGLGRVPRQQFAWYRVANPVSSPLHVHDYYCERSEGAFDRWVTDDDQSRCKLSPGQVCDVRQRKREAAEYDLNIWALFLNMSPRYKHLQGKSFREKMVEVANGGTDMELPLEYREMFVRYCPSRKGGH
ncbi:hypothetical protein FKW77_005815 [Venturia effusa]|uniref:Uncharacterized protein n=1 Tax=Venturia effusa TaxID=50376 RepID=A0A517LDS9_9PEZI|nr:hypothetical protein FKW77_005815 [Venturia effusa]